MVVNPQFLPKYTSEKVLDIRVGPVPDVVMAGNVDRVSANASVGFVLFWSNWL